MICDTCKKQTRKFYRYADEEPKLACKKCILNSSSKANCYTCSKTGQMYVTFDDDGTATAAYCKSCFLLATKADEDDIAEYRDYLEEDMQ